MAARPVSFTAFFLMWAQQRGWEVPQLHVRICHWLETCREPERVLMVFRGAAKSTIYAVYKAWRLYRDHSHRSLVWSADGPTAEMLTADVINVLRNHPLTFSLLAARKPGKKRFWVNGTSDARNASMRSVGVDSNATGARADDVDFDDIEVPGNIETPEARAKLRNRIGDSTHILVPGGQATYIGTPHTMDSIYPEQIAAGAAVLKIPLFAHSMRFTDTSKRTRYEFSHRVGADGLYVMAGIYKGARMLVEGIDYRFDNGAVVFPKPPGVVFDIASCCAWPERFTRKEVELRRRKTRTLNGWDSQYLLEAKPLTEIRLDPTRLKAYDVEPIFRVANGEMGMWLGRARIVGASCKWDPSSGKLRSDASSVAVVLQDDGGARYWHRAARLRGEVAEFAPDGKTITGGQVWHLCDLVAQLRIPRIVVETNGAGTFAPAVLKAALKQRKLVCGVTEKHESDQKNRRILEAIEPPLTSGKLWAHVSVARGDAALQMRDWNPAVKNQPDDDLDALAGAISETPERIGRIVSPDSVWNASGRQPDDWRPAAGNFEVELQL